MIQQCSKSNPSPPEQRPCSAKTSPNPVEVNLYAQRLNNSAAFCIEVGEYDRAISSLGKALRLSNLHKDNQIEDFCSCYSCTIEACISYSERVPASMNNLGRVPGHSSENNHMACSGTNKKRRLSRLSPHSIFKSHFWEPEGKCKDEPLSFYRRPIHVTPSSMLEGHNMGSTLFLIIIFNLALAHHCAQVSSSSCEAKRIAKLKNTSKLYKLADSWYQRHKKYQSINSDNTESGQKRKHCDPDRFGMILNNNSSHVYFLLNDRANYEDSLRRLTTSLMLAVDHKKTRSQQFQPANEQDYEHEDDESYCVDERSFLRRASDNLHIEEFLRSASHLILRKQCADAA